MSEAAQTSTMTPFRRALLAFLLADGIDAVDVTDEPWGTDWAGDTEAGFYSSFSCTLRWTTAAGRVGHKECEGDEMARLWRFLVGYVPPD